MKVLRERQRMLERELKLNLKVIEGSIGSVQEIDIGNSPEYVNSHRTDSKRNMNTRGTVESEKRSYIKWLEIETNSSETVAR